MASGNRGIITQLNGKGRPENGGGLFSIGVVASRLGAKTKDTHIGTPTSPLTAAMLAAQRIGAMMKSVVSAMSRPIPSLRLV